MALSKAAVLAILGLWFCWPFLRLDNFFCCNNLTALTLLNCCWTTLFFFNSAIFCLRFFISSNLVMTLWFEAAKRFLWASWAFFFLILSRKAALILALTCSFLLSTSFLLVASIWEIKDSFSRSNCCCCCNALSAFLNWASAINFCVFCNFCLAANNLNASLKSSLESSAVNIVWLENNCISLSNCSISLSIELDPPAEFVFNFLFSCSICSLMSWISSCICLTVDNTLIASTWALSLSALSFKSILAFSELKPILDTVGNEALGICTLVVNPCFWGWTSWWWPTWRERTWHSYLMCWLAHYVIKRQELEGGRLLTWFDGVKLF